MIVKEVKVLCLISACYLNQSSLENGSCLVFVSNRSFL